MTPPKFLVNLYWDLQDRRLMPLVVILLVAILALPIALSQNADPGAPPAPTAAANEDKIPTLPAVLTSDPGLRDYRERLDSLRSKDPFVQKFSGASEAAAAAATVSKVADLGGGGAASPDAAPIAGSGSDTTSTGSASAATAGAVSSSGSSEASSTTSTTGTTSTGSGDSGTSSSQGSSTGGKQWFTYRIDVTTGRAGDAEERKDVKRGTVLPSQSNPVAMFISVSEGGNRAHFLVSRDVVTTHGEGACLPSPSDCQILTLKVGQERSFDFAPGGDEPDRYVIKLDAIRVVEIDPPKSSQSSSDKREPQSARTGLRAFLGF
jgi:hypothetical protein